ncbi:MAG: SPFH domain-containing protein [Planctomycetota bacterium]|nr:SPFH domain-containing protein [Planctomycetota bacterium]
MATISRLFGLRHLRSEPNVHVHLYKRGRLRRSGRGLALWFFPLSASVAEIPCDDRDETFLFHARTSDFQDVTAQGVITYRVAQPDVLAERVDFSLDLRTGRYRGEPLQQLSQLLVQAAQQRAWHYLAGASLEEVLVDGVDEVRARIRNGLANDETIAAMGLEIVAVRVAGVTPTEEIERALQAPAHESIQQAADEAVFQRRALAVEKERAIQENELQNQIELARREEQLISQQGQNERQRAQEASEAGRIEAEGEAERARMQSSAKADSIRAIEEARVTAESERMAIYRELPSHVLMGMAAQEFAAKLRTIEHLSVTPEMLGPMLSDLLRATTRKLEPAAKGQG